MLASLNKALRQTRGEGEYSEEEIMKEIGIINEVGSVIDVSGKVQSFKKMETDFNNINIENIVDIRL